MTLDQPVPPQLDVGALGCVAAGTAGQWRSRWSLVNRSSGALTLVAAWHPHGKFRGAEQALDPAVVLPAEDSAEIETTVRCQEPPGAEVENAFLVLRMEDQDGHTWRIFARLRVAVDAIGIPQPRVEVVTVQRVGFSRESASSEPLA